MKLLAEPAWALKRKRLRRGLVGEGSREHRDYSASVAAISVLAGRPAGSILPPSLDGVRLATTRREASIRCRSRETARGLIGEYGSVESAMW